MSLLFFAFIGWEMIGHLAEEFRRPRKDIPLSLGLAALVINVLYLLIAFVTIGTLAYQSATPLTAMITLAAYGWGEQAIINIITNGKDNQMPAHADKLTPAQIRVLAAYVWGFSNGPAASARTANAQ